MNKSEINSIQWNGKDSRLRIAPSLCLQIRKHSKTYVFRQMVNGKTISRTIGSVSHISLTEAKKKAHDMKYQTFETRVLFREVAEKYIKESTLKQHRAI